MKKKIKIELELTEMECKYLFDVLQRVAETKENENEIIPCILLADYLQSKFETL